jgi:hypothetical protein
MLHGLRQGLLLRRAKHVFHQEKGELQNTTVGEPKERGKGNKKVTPEMNREKHPHHHQKRDYH